MSVSELDRRAHRVSRLRYRASLRLGLLLLLTTTLAQAVQQSDVPRWSQIRHALFGDRSVLDGTQVIGLDTPARALDAAVVPVTIAMKLAQTPERHVSKLYLVVDNNPAPVAAVFEFPGDRAWSTIATRIRVNAYTDVRVVAELNTGDLFMTSNFVKASGGCSAPASKDAEAAKAQMGKMKLILPKAQASGPGLAKLLIRHPNSSGLQFDQITRNFIPADYVRSIDVDYQGRPLFKVATDISISEDPAISFDLLPGAAGTVTVRATDSQGRQFDRSFELAPPP